VTIRPAVRALILYLVAQTAAVAVIFLFVSSFFHGWDGAVVSVRQPRTPDPAVYQVLIKNRDNSTTERNWPATVVKPLALQVDPQAFAPTAFPEDGILTRKSRFQLFFLVQAPVGDGGERTWQSVPTVSAQAVGIAFLAWFIFLGLRNMLYAGSPFAITRSKLFLPKAQSAAGAVATGGGRGARGMKGPPPSRKSRGPRR
jgi:amino acid transporter